MTAYLDLAGPNFSGNSSIDISKSDDKSASESSEISLARREPENIRRVFKTLPSRQYNIGFYPGTDIEYIILDDASQESQPTKVATQDDGLTTENEILDTNGIGNISHKNKAIHMRPELHTGKVIRNHERSEEDIAVLSTPHVVLKDTSESKDATDKITGLLALSKAKIARETSLIEISYSQASTLCQNWLLSHALIGHATKGSDETPEAPQASSLHQSFSVNPFASSITRASDAARSSLERLPRNKMSCKERKRIIVLSTKRPAKVTEAMKEWHIKTSNLLDPFRKDDDCWLHPSPPPARRSPSGAFRPCGKINKTFHWHDQHGRHSLVINYGIVCKIIFHKLTKMQKDGFVQKQWHLSHLCGNWTCLNSAHTTVEPGGVNVSRNSCFSHRGGCCHEPKCMKEKKVPLGADGKIVNRNKAVPAEVVLGEPEDEWMMQNVDGDMMVDEETDFADYSEALNLELQSFKTL